YLDASLRVYNREGRRDNKFKARIKILVKETGVDTFRDKVEKEWLAVKDGPMTLTDQEVARCKGFFTPPAYKTLPAEDEVLNKALSSDVLFASWHARNVAEHQRPGYAIVTVSVKKTGSAPGDVTTAQL